MFSCKWHLTFLSRLMLVDCLKRGVEILIGWEKNPFKIGMEKVRMYLRGRLTEWQKEKEKRKKKILSSSSCPNYHKTELNASPILASEKASYLRHYICLTGFINRKRESGQYFITAWINDENWKTNKPIVSFLVLSYACDNLSRNVALKFYVCTA